MFLKGHHDFVVCQSAIRLFQSHATLHAAVSTEKTFYRPQHTGSMLDAGPARAKLAHTQELVDAGVHRANNLPSFTFFQPSQFRKHR